MIEILPRPQQVEQSQLNMWVDESIWGHRLYDEQTPWLCILEMLCITQSEAGNGRAFVESKFNDLRYEIYPRLYLRNILFNNPHIEAVATEYLDDNERWQMWMDVIASNVGGLISPDFSYLKSRFGSSTKRCWKRLRKSRKQNIARTLLQQELRQKSNSTWRCGMALRL